MEMLDTGTNGQTSVAPKPGMFAGMVAHIDQPGCFLNGLKGCFHYGIRFTCKGNDRPVGGITRINIEQFDPGHFFNDLR